tara:strand:- start:214 stop:315 length:102 start_codon:yes stop_codon:yes gene_type:complete
MNKIFMLAYITAAIIFGLGLEIVTESYRKAKEA